MVGRRKYRHGGHLDAFPDGQAPLGQAGRSCDRPGHTPDKVLTSLRILNITKPIDLLIF
jgi:hypothetical protein